MAGVRVGWVLWVRTRWVVVRVAGRRRWVAKWLGLVGWAKAGDDRSASARVAAKGAMRRIVGFWGARRAPEHLLL